MTYGSVCCTPLFRRAVARNRACAMLVAAMAIFAADVGSAQTYYGAVRGHVRDLQGGIPGAHITLVNDETAAARSTVANGTGEYLFANVVPGTYTIRAAAPGFGLEERGELRIATQTSLVVDFLLSIDGLVERVTVTAAGPVGDGASGGGSTTLTARDISALPMFGRNTFYSAIATPAVIQSGDPQFVRYQDQTNSSMLSLAGGLRRGNAYLVDGVSITDFLNRPAWMPSTEAIDEMRVHVRTYDADVGRSAGGVFNVAARSGTNDWHGSGLFLTKPGWTTGRLFFARRANIPKPPQHYYNWAGSFGGPLVRDRTFVWFSKDDYWQRSTRNNVLTLPTARERAGDFSQSFDSRGIPIVIYDPRTTRPDPDRPGEYIRAPFPGNIIPPDRIDPVARAILSHVPLPGAGRAFNTQATIDDGPQRQETLKLDHRWTTAWTISGMYAHQRTREPGAAFWGPHGSRPGDPGNNVLTRTIHFFAVNSTVAASPRAALAIRYGYNRFTDHDEVREPRFDAATLGLPDHYVRALTYNGFPRVSASGYSLIGNSGPNVVNHLGHTANVSVFTLIRRHSIEIGGDYRRIAANATDLGAAPGAFTFTQGFTQGPTPNTVGTASGDAIATFLLGVPAAGLVHIGTPAGYRFDYYALYAQDEFRLGPAMTITAGLRYEHEPGMAAGENRMTVGFDRDAAFPIQIPGMTLRGGLMYAGVDGNPTRQGRPLDAVAPRAGIAWAVTARTIARGGYGLFWAPTQIPGITEAAIGARGYSAVTPFVASTDGGLTPAGSLSNPFPDGLVQPHGSALGLATGAGGAIDFIDQDARPGSLQQYSVDVQQQIGNGMVVGIAYLGSRGGRLSVGGTTAAVVNINQLDARHFALGPALLQQVPNPFHGISAFGAFSRAPTIAHGQLLRPFPQFDDVRAHRVNVARSRYNAMVARWSRPMQHGYAFDVNYTIGRLEDNQFGEANSFSNRLASPLNNYDLEAEYGVSILDVTHRLNFTATVDLPFGETRRYIASRGLPGALLGGWSVTVAGRYQTGFPLNIWQSSNNSGLFGSTQRPNLVAGVDPMTRGSQQERAVGGWIDPRAFTAATPFSFGNVPRTNPAWRGPGQRTTDLAVQKVARLGGKTVSVRADILNVFDDPLFQGPVTAFGTTDFGRITSVGGFARSMQFHVRIGF